MTKKLQIVDETTLTKIKTDLDIAKSVVLTASTPQELEKALFTLVGIKETLRLAKMKFKEIEAEPKAQIKTLDTYFNELDNEVKEKAISMYDEKFIQKVNKDTGEVKQAIENNLGSKRFVYTPEKVKFEIDKDELIKLNKFTKEVVSYVIDNEALEAYIAEHGTKDLPMKEVKTEKKLGIQYAAILSELQEKIEGDK